MWIRGALHTAYYQFPHPGHWNCSSCSVMPSVPIHMNGMIQSKEKSPLREVIKFNYYKLYIHRNSASRNWELYRQCGFDRCSLRYWGWCYTRIMLITVVSPPSFLLPS
ncbi:hypothetical protein BDV23DRAFT_82549 [Aspergillus alliaceus]|uniref:Uncharacterized protein n=1 Tax=Petromyces alliaceus TaxID=209559 RepID=A0A5N7C9E5_PETAA|nr:hypothetical protein BDV23DRAFT_82549 [Aspergillus alliaceus]